MKRRIVVTGFEPYGGSDVNPSQRIVQRLAAGAPHAAAVSTCVLPVVYGRAFAQVAVVLEAERPHAVVLLGLGPGRPTLDFERFGVNWHGGALADNDGALIEGAPIDPGGPAAYFATLPIPELVAACREAGVPAAASSHAGTFLCNQLLYQALRFCDRHDLATRVGFIHLPLLPEQAKPGQPSLSEDLMFAGVRAVLSALAERP